MSNNKFMDVVEQKRKEKQDNKPPAPETEKYNQEKDADLTGIKPRGKHFVFKAPSQKKDSGIILPENMSKQKVGDVDGGSFNDDIRAILVDDNCTKVEQGNMVMLSPHYQALKVVLPADDGSGDKVLYAVVHEDYVILTKE